ncbi:MAG TPA: hypothetical protein VII20_16770 [Roseiarcus sp.]|jgi:hypothetical protein
MDMRRIKMGAVGLGVTALMMAVQGATPALGMGVGFYDDAFKGMALLNRIFGEEVQSFTGREKNDAFRCIKNTACLDMLRAGYPDAFKDEK